MAKKVISRGGLLPRPPTAIGGGGGWGLDHPAPSVVPTVVSTGVRRNSPFIYSKTFSDADMMEHIDVVNDPVQGFGRPGIGLLIENTGSNPLIYQTFDGIGWCANWSVAKSVSDEIPCTSGVRIEQIRVQSVTGGTSFRVRVYPGEAPI